MARTSRRMAEIEARKAADPLARAVGREDIDYSSDELLTAPRVDGHRFKTVLRSVMSGLLGKKRTCEVCEGPGLLQRMDGKSVVTCPECDGDGFTYDGNSEIAALAGGAIGSSR